MQFNSLKKNENFHFVYKYGNSFVNDYFVMYTQENNMESNRYGISVSKKIGNACVRHKVKRTVKEIVRLNEQIFGKGYDVIFVARKRIVKGKYFDIEKKIKELATKTK